MSNNSPWSVKGIENETRQAVKAAAKERGMTVGQWLTEAILAAASAQLQSTKDVPAAGTDGPLSTTPLPQDMGAAIAELTREVRALREAGQPVDGSADAVADGSLQAPLEFRISRLEAQISELADAVEAAMLPPRHLEPWEKESHLGYGVLDNSNGDEDAVSEAPQFENDEEDVAIDEPAVELTAREKERRLRGLLSRFLEN
jgi:hypothetical protein